MKSVEVTSACVRHSNLTLGFQITPRLHV